MTPRELLHAAEKAGGLVTVETDGTIACRKIPQSLAPLILALDYEEIAAALQHQTDQLVAWVASNTVAGHGFSSSARILYRESEYMGGFEKFVQALTEMGYEQDGSFLVGLALATDVAASEFWQQEAAKRAGLEQPLSAKKRSTNGDFQAMELWPSGQQPEDHCPYFIDK